MATIRHALEQSADHVAESMGVRQTDANRRLTPIASPKDVGRTPHRRFGRLAVSQITTDPNQPRNAFCDEEIARLAASIRRTGQLHPIRVRWDAACQKWTIITGERRYRATMAAGIDSMDCYFHDDGITPSEILEQQLVENLLRKELKPLEQARGYVALMQLNNWTGKQAAAALNVSPSKVSRALALLDLPPDVQARIETEEMSRSTAYELSKLDNSQSVNCKASLPKKKREGR